MRDNMVNSSNTSSRLAILLFLGYICGVKGAITSLPRNTATKVGNQTYLNCTGNNGVPGWRFGELGKDFPLVGLGSCSVSSNYSSRYRSEAQGSNTCNLIVSNPSLLESGIYTCQDLDTLPKYAVLTVLSSSGTPTVKNGSEVVEGDQLTMTCAVQYRTASETLISVPIAPNLNWTTSGISIPNAVTSKTNVSVTSSITVVATRDGIPTYDCTAQFVPPANKPDSAPNAPSNVYIGGTYPITGVYYGPTTPNISRRTVNVTSNSDIVCSFIELTCNSSANPSPSYTWTDVITRNVVATSNVLALAEDNRTYQCTASNKVKSSSATYTTGVSQPRQCTPSKADNIRIYSDDGHCISAGNFCSCVNGSHVNLICEVTNAYPLPTVTWTDGYGNVLSSISFFNATANGSYTCRTSNKINTLTNTTAAKSARVTHCVQSFPAGYTTILSQSSTRSYEKGDTSAQYWAAKTAAIVLGVLFGVSLLIIGALILSIILRKILTSAGQNTKNSKTRGQNSLKLETVNHPLETFPPSAYQDLSPLPNREQPNQYEQLTPDTQYSNLGNANTDVG